MPPPTRPAGRDGARVLKGGAASRWRRDHPQGALLGSSCCWEPRAPRRSPAGPPVARRAPPWPLGGLPGSRVQLAQPAPYRCHPQPHGPAALPSAHGDGAHRGGRGPAGAGRAAPAEGRAAGQPGPLPGAPEGGLQPAAPLHHAVPVPRARRGQGHHGHRAGAGTAAAAHGGSAPALGTAHLSAPWGHLGKQGLGAPAAATCSRMSLCRPRRPSPRTACGRSGRSW